MILVNDTGDSSRSSDLGVMSPARYPCATPVKSFVALVLRRLAYDEYRIPPVGFDPTTSKL